jgi:hypothetical protein
MEMETRRSQEWDHEENICDTCGTDHYYLDAYFGLCPVCHASCRYLNIGKGHWYYCEEHKVRAFIGSNLFSSWRYETEEEQRARYDELDFGSYEDVELWQCPALLAENARNAMHYDDGQ